MGACIISIQCRTGCRFWLPWTQTRTESAHITDCSTGPKIVKSTRTHKRIYEPFLSNRLRAIQALQTRGGLSKLTLGILMWPQQQRPAQTPEHPPHPDRDFHSKSQRKSTTLLQRFPTRIVNNMLRSKITFTHLVSTSDVRKRIAFIG